MWTDFTLLVTVGLLLLCLQLTDAGAFFPPRHQREQWAKSTSNTLDGTINNTTASTLLAVAASSHPETTGKPNSSSGDARDSTSRPERGKFLPDIANEQDLYDAYTEIQSDYETKAFASRDWQVLNTKHNVTVSILQHPDDPTCPYVKMQGTIPVPVDSCWNFLRVSDWDRNMPKMDPFYEGVQVHGEYELSVSDPHPRRHPQPSRQLAYPAASTSSQAVHASTLGGSSATDGSTLSSRVHRTVRMILCRKRMKRLLAFGKRDLVFLSVTEDEPLADGTRVSGTVSVRTNLLPRVPGYTRAFQDSIAFYKPVQNGTATYVEIIPM
jgi:hypothetical protein